MDNGTIKRSKAVDKVLSLLQNIKDNGIELKTANMTVLNAVHGTNILKKQLQGIDFSKDVTYEMADRLLKQRNMRDRGKNKVSSSQPQQEDALVESADKLLKCIKAYERHKSLNSNECIYNHDEFFWLTKEQLLSCNKVCIRKFISEILSYTEK